MSNGHEFQPGGSAGLEPLGRYRAGRGIGGTMRAVFDVLYEAGEPLDLGVLTERTFDRVDATAHYHARRAYLRKLQAQAKWRNKQRETTRTPVEAVLMVSEQVPLKRAWGHHLRRLLEETVRRGPLIRDEDKRYRPNPARPPRVEQPDGRVLPYTREQALGLGELERAIGDVLAIRPELDRFLRGLTEGELRQVVELVATSFAPEPGERLDPRTLRKRLRWLLARPSTDAGRAWLLGELVRRAYGEPPTLGGE